MSETRVLYARNAGRAAGTRRRHLSAVVLRTLNLKNLRQWSTERLRQPGAAPTGGGRNMTFAGANFSFAAGDRGCHVRDSCFVRTKRGASCWDSSLAVSAVVYWLGCISPYQKTQVSGVGP